MNVCASQGKHGPYSQEALALWFKDNSYVAIPVLHLPTNMIVSAPCVGHLHLVPDISRAIQLPVPVQPIPALQNATANANGSQMDSVTEIVKTTPKNHEGDHNDLDVEMEDVTLEEVANWIIGLRTTGPLVRAYTGKFCRHCSSIIISYWELQSVDFMHVNPWQHQMPAFLECGCCIGYDDLVWVADR